MKCSKNFEVEGYIKKKRIGLALNVDKRERERERERERQLNE